MGPVLSLPLKGKQKAGTIALLGNFFLFSQESQRQGVGVQTEWVLKRTVRDDNEEVVETR